MTIDFKSQGPTGSNTAQLFKLSQNVSEGAWYAEQTGRELAARIRQKKEKGAGAQGVYLKRDEKKPDDQKRDKQAAIPTKKNTVDVKR